MSTDGPFLECYDTIALRSYYNAKRGIACIYKGLILIGKATKDLLVVMIILVGLGYAFSITLLLRLSLRLFHWMKPNRPDTLPRFEPLQKTS